MSIRVNRDEAITVTIPYAAHEFDAHHFFKSKKHWVQEAVEKMRLRPKPVMLLPKGNRRDYEKYKEQARKLVIDKLHAFNAFYNFSWNNVTIKHTSSRWGSCSKLKNLNFNYRIVFLPKEYADYLIVHELCHLKELNHSSAFWTLVEKTIPDYKTYRREIRIL